MGPPAVGNETRSIIRVAFGSVKAAWNAANLGLEPAALEAAVAGAAATKAALTDSDQQRWGPWCGT